MFVCALRLYPATPGWGVRCGCVCFGSGFGCAPPLLAGVLGCVCVFVCMLRLYPATPGWGLRRGCVCLGRVSAAPRRSWLGCWAVCVSVRALRFVPCGSWPGRAVRVCVLRLGFRLRPGTPGWGVGVCVSVCVRASLVPRHSWLGCAVWVCLLGLGFRLCPANPGWSVRCWCVCLGSGSAVPRHCWLGCWGVFVFVCALRLYPATPDWRVRCGCVCLGSDFGCAPPLLPGVLGCVCVGVRAPLAPRHS